VNGVSVSIQSFRDEFVARGHVAHIFCPSYPPRYGSSTSEEGLHRYPSMPAGISREDRLIWLHELPALFADLDAFEPDVIHVNTEFTMGIAAKLYARRRGYPILVTAHTDYEDYVCNYVRFVNPRALRAFSRFVMRRIFEAADILVTPSPAMERKLGGYGIGKGFHVVPTGIPAFFAPRPAEEVAAYRARLEARFPRLAGKKLLVFAGRVTEEKDVGFLLPVLERVDAASGGNVALLVAGDGPNKEALVRAAARRGLAPKIAFLGYVPRRDLPLVYCLGEAFVFPSRTETLGLCTIEAMATGLPVVAIGEMGTRDVMQGDHGGFMVKGDSTEFSDAVLRLLGDPGLRKAKSEEAMAWSRRYSIAAAADALLEVYAEASASRGRARE
jgi:glycosyltransferase involved in cell wall biosynthesis